MPRPTFPPTPGSSTDMKARDDAAADMSYIPFELPPPAIANAESRPSSVDTKYSASSGSSYHPTSQKTSAASSSRRRSAAAAAGSGSKGTANFSLPPPPTRLPKIIQMKPQGQQGSTAKSNIETAGKKGAAPGASKRKQPSATSVAGRKMARKTAHSHIERRRRSKMNEEFGVLKDLIPACTGNMHKLAILQASIDYIRYLEECVDKLKTQTNRDNRTPESSDYPAPPGAREGDEYDRYPDEDVEMEESETDSPVLASTAIFPPPNPRQLSTSPISPVHEYHEKSLYSSTSTSDKRHYSFSASATTSPAFGPRASEYAGSSASLHSALSSPALQPQRTGDRDVDHEATAALLMLNADRRGTVGSMSGRGMSVKDLLSA